MADGGLDSVDGSVWPESRWPAPFLLRDEAEGMGSSGAAMDGSAADFAEERVTLDDISSCDEEIARFWMAGSS